MAKQQAFNWMFTINNPRDEESPLLWSGVHYVVFQKERGENGTPHWQGYVQWEKIQRITALKKICPRAHWECRMGSHEQAVAYCTKKETRISPPIRKGVPRIVVTKKQPKVQDGCDMATVLQLIEEGKSFADIEQYSFRLACQYKHAILSKIADRTGPRKWKTNVVIVWGSTGVGKSRMLNELFPDAYWKPKGKWWNGYSGQETVIFDDFYGWLEIDCLLRLCDRYPLLTELKGGVVQFVARNVIFTSNSSWDSWYKAWRPEHLAAMRRRIELEIHVDVHNDGVQDVVSWEKWVSGDGGAGGWVGAIDPREEIRNVCH